MRRVRPTEKTLRFLILNSVILVFGNAQAFARCEEHKVESISSTFVVEKTLAGSVPCLIDEKNEKLADKNFPVPGCMLELRDTKGGKTYRIYTSSEVCNSKINSRVKLKIGRVGCCTDFPSFLEMTKCGKGDPPHLFSSYPDTDAERACMNRSWIIHK